MGKFKVGDKVIITVHRPCLAPLTVGDIVEIVDVERGPVVRRKEDTRSWFVHFSQLKPYFRMEENE